MPNRIVVGLARTTLACAVALAVVAGARAESNGGPKPELVVYAAASLTGVVDEIAREFRDPVPGRQDVVVSFGASSDLARQIADGAPADVFVSASPEWVEFLEQAKATSGAPVVVARNALVCITKKGSALATAAGTSGAADSSAGRIGSGSLDPSALLGRLADGDLVAIADAGVPAGEYARASLAKLGLMQRFERRLVGQKDVRAVLHAVEQGEVAAGFVYATDARAAEDTVVTLFAFDRATHPPIEYHAVVVRHARDAALARRFVTHLRSEAARARLARAGFVLPER